MARSRNIKPGFFTNEYLADLDPLTRILFAGLWCLADKEGRLEYRPKRIKAAILPFDDVNVESCLDQLCVKHDSSMDQPFIYIYEVDGKRYIQVAKWHTHQSPHHKEVDSIIPEIGDAQLATSTEVTKHDSSMRQACVKHDSINTPLVPLIPDSLNLIPDSLNLDTGKQKRKSQRFTPPALEDVTAYCIERANSIDPEAFIAYYQANGWKVGKSSMVDWKAAVITWEKNGHSNGHKPKRSAPREGF